MRFAIVKFLSSYQVPGLDITQKFIIVYDCLKLFLKCRKKVAEVTQKKGAGGRLQAALELKTQESNFFTK